MRAILVMVAVAVVITTLAWVARRVLGLEASNAMFAYTAFVVLCGGLGAVALRRWG
jgi:hypothetical protein